tara:strand:+ start:131691 stop:131906 length:216 start_codon:yes stop_codon:yes gene_type:complete
MRNKTAKLIRKKARQTAHQASWPTSNPVVQFTRKVQVGGGIVELPGTIVEENSERALYKTFKRKYKAFRRA